MQNKKWMCKLHIHFFAFAVLFIGRFILQIVILRNKEIKNPERMVWFGAENRVEVHKNDEKRENAFICDGENRKLGRILHRKCCAFFLA